MRAFAILLVFVFAAQAAFAAIDSTLTSLAPSSSTLLTGIDVQRAGASGSGNRMLERVIDDQGVAKLVSSIGLNLRRDLRHLLLVGVGQQPTSESQTVVIANGTFDPARLMSAGRLRGVSVKRFSGFVAVTQGTGVTAPAVAFPRSGVLVMGNLRMVQTVLTSRAHRGNIDAVLRDQVSQIGPENDVWFATTLSGSFLADAAGDALPSQVRTSGALERISRSAGGLQFGPSDKVVLNLVARSPTDARLLSGVLGVAATIARLQLRGNSGLVLAETVLTSMQLSVDDSTVHLVSTLPDAQLERALISPN